VKTILHTNKQAHMKTSAIYQLQGYETFILPFFRLLHYVF